MDAAFARMIELHSQMELLAEADNFSEADGALFTRLTGEFAMAFGYAAALDAGMTDDQAMGVAPILADELSRSVNNQLAAAGT